MLDYLQTKCYRNVIKNEEREVKVKKVTVQVEDCLYDFYRKVGQQAGDIPVEKVMADALFKLAGELSLNALGKQKRAECR